MSASDLLRRLDEDATPGPWEATGSEVDTADRWSGCSSARSITADADARLIATLRTLLPELRAVVEAAEDAAPRADGYRSTADDSAIWDALRALDARAAELGGTDG